MNKRILGALFLSIILLAGCGTTDSSEEQDEPIKIGVNGGHAEIITNIVIEEAAKEGIELEIVEFNDWITPNRTLTNGEIDLNMYQTKQFLEEYVENHNEPLAAVGTTYSVTLGVYSEKYDSLDELPDGAMIGVMNDPINLWRSLLLYEKAGLIKLDPTVEVGTINDIEENPRDFEFKEIEGTLMLRTLNSMDASLAANASAIDQGRDPAEAIYIEEGTDFPMVLAAREEEKDNPVYQRITELYHSNAVKEYMAEEYEDVLLMTEDPFQLD